MKIHLFSALLLLGSAAASDNGGERKRNLAATLVDQRKLHMDVENGHVTDFIEVKVRPDPAEVIQDHVEKIRQDSGCHTATRIFPFAGIHESDHVAAGLDRWFRLECSENAAEEAKQLSPVGKGAQKAIAKLVEAMDASDEADPYRIEKLSPEYAIAKTGFKSSSSLRGSRVLQGETSNDPDLSDQTHYATINLFSAWEIMSNNNAWVNASKAVVHVLDSGWDFDHPDLGDNAWENPGEACGDTTGDGSDNDGNNLVDDCKGWNHADNSPNLLGDGSHGSHCAGTIAANTDNGVGVAGVAGGLDGHRGASVMVGLGFGTSSTSGFDRSMVYAADHGAHISSNSWGYTSAGAYDQSMLDAIDYAIGKGVIVVFAAGNDDSNGAHYPGYHPPVMAVAATNDNSNAASFTNYGDWIDISAPGVDVLSTVIRGDGPGGSDYARYSGTSMACPHVAGVLALGIAIRPKASPDALKDCLYTTAVDLNSAHTSTKYEGGLGAGMVDAAAFLNCLTVEGCGNSIVEGTELCDGTSVPGKTCQDFDFSGGTLRCSSGCDAYDTSGCVNAILEESGLSGLTGSERRYTVNVHQGATSVVFRTTEAAGSSGDADLYVRHSSQPETNSFDCRSWTHSSNEVCTDTRPGTYHIMVRGYTAYENVDLLVTADGSSVTTPTTSMPTGEPTPRPTSEPTSKPTFKPTSKPTSKPTAEPTTEPTSKPTSEPTSKPTSKPTSTPSARPSLAPTSQPSAGPSLTPTSEPSAGPSLTPTTEPSAGPTSTMSPSASPSFSPSTSEPTARPSHTPTFMPSQEPSDHPTNGPSQFPSESAKPSTVPSRNPSASPTKSSGPSPFPTITTSPSNHPFARPSSVPSRFPSFTPSSVPSNKPSAMPSELPTKRPSQSPITRSPITDRPTASPSVAPTDVPDECDCDAETTCERAGFPEGGVLECVDNCHADTSRCMKVIDIKEDLSASTGYYISGNVGFYFATTEIRFEMSGGTGDADFYVRVGEDMETWSDYHCRPYRVGNNEICVDRGGFNEITTYYWRIRAYSAFSGVTLKIVADGEYGPPGSDCAESCVSPTEWEIGCPVCPQCESIVCAADEFCCSNTWDGLCDDAVPSLC